MYSTCKQLCIDLLLSTQVLAPHHKMPWCTVDCCKDSLTLHSVRMQMKAYVKTHGVQAQNAF